MQSIDPMYCPYDQLRHCGRTHTHTFILHLSTFTSSWICVCDWKHPPWNNLSTLSLHCSLHWRYHWQWHRWCPRISTPHEDGQRQAGVSPLFCQWNWATLPGYQKCHQHWHMLFIPKSLVPAHKHPTYGHICCNYWPQKDEKHCGTLTAGGNPINYPGNKSTPMADLNMTKLFINSTISTPGAKFLGINLANFHLNTPMPNPKYMCLCLTSSPMKSWNHCPLQPSQHCHSWRLGLAWDSKRDVWSSPSQGCCKSTTWNTPCHQRVLPMPTYTWSLAPHLSKHHILPSGRQFWHQGHQHAQHGPPRQCIEGTLHCCSQHDRFSFLRHSSNLELLARTRWLPHSRVHQQSRPKVPTPHTSLSPTRSLQGSPNPVWCTGSEGGGQHHTTPHPEGDQMCLRHCQYPLLLCVSSWHNTSSCTQHHCSTPKQWHIGSGWCMSPTPWLGCYTSQWRHCIQGMQHGTVGTYGRIIPFQTRQ